MILSSLLFILNVLFAAPSYTQTFQQTNYGYTGKYSLQSGTGPYPPDSTSLSFDVHLRSKSCVHIKIFDPSHTSYEIPDTIQQPDPAISASNPDYDITFENNGIQVKRKGSSATIFDSSCQSRAFVFAKQFIQIATTTSQDPIIHGLGERRTEFALKVPQNITVFNQDNLTPRDENLYGHHPFMIDVQPDGSCHGILFFNAYPLEVELNNGFISFRSMGGSLDFYIFTGPTIKDITQQYTDLVGKPCLVPQWSFGFHNCRWGYPSLASVQDAMERYHKANLPIDVMWFDIDYMDEKRLFTTNPTLYPPAEMKAFLEKEKAEYGVYSVSIVDPGVKIDTNYETYTSLLETGLYINESDGWTPLEGNVWPGPVIFPDFTNPAVQSWWTRQFDKFLGTVPFDGIWNDMNEIANFCNGYCDDTRQKQTFPWQSVDIYKKQIPPESMLSTGPYISSRAFYANQENIRTVDALKSLRPGLRPFVLTRSSFVGAGRVNVKWLGDDSGTYQDMKDSIAGVITSGLFGIPYTGADIGGFLFSGSPELLIRWTEMATFLYPFFRVHSCESIPAHELFRFGEPYVSISRKYLHLRQTLQSYWYTLHHVSHDTGVPMVRSLSMEFPTDAAVRRIDTQAMLGSALLVSPALAEHQREVEAYVPEGRWFDFFRYDEVKVGQPRTAKFQCELDEVVVLLRGGEVMTIQEQHNHSITFMKDTPLTVLAALNEKNEASGCVTVDDGLGDQICTTTVQFTATQSRVQFVVKNNDFKTDQTVKHITVLGLAGKKVSSVTTQPLDQNITFLFDEKRGVLDIFHTGKGWRLDEDRLFSF
ncbi:putative Lysosomal alpha-glucosidase [Blattamonas nauphoetae]|uniref:Maltase n=1 Tax=Blattamonas nauphoetae TaxID=2049346 RepID=A0ABQ9X2Q0_9EUKA|nr:putative Lysosomal alpha-glucosidase [Blattamonas nauphoetae]